MNKTGRGKPVKQPQRSGASTVPMEQMFQNFAVSRNHPLPKSFRAKLRYSQEVLLNPGAGSLATNVFSASSLYDPDNTGIGHQPYGFDQLCSSTGFYDQFIVTKSTCRIRCANPSSTIQGFLALSLTDTNSVTASEIAAVSEQPLTVTAVLPTSGACLCNTLMLTYDAASFYGVSKDALLARTDLMGSFAGNPSENAWFVIYLTGLGSGDMPSTAIIVDIEYDAVFQEPRKLGMS